MKIPISEVENELQLDERAKWAIFFYLVITKKILFLCVYDCDSDQTLE